jgi:release factor glutamine methyltransferase
MKPAKPLQSFARESQSMTVLEAIQRSAEFLSRKGVEPSRLHAELLLAHALKLPRMQLYLKFERSLQPEELDQYRELVRRRGTREPLQQVVGSTSFCGYEIAVNRNVLVPRPETELLAERSWKFLKELGSSAPTALDFGTGSGCLAIALAAECPTATLFAVDSSAQALELARSNAEQAKVAERVHFLHSDGFGALPPEVRLDLVVSNPPYIPSGEIASLEPEVREFEPRQALDGGPEGLDFYRRLAAEAGARLRSGGKLMVELGDGQAQATREVFEKQKWIVEAIEDDYTARPRILVARVEP